MIVDMFNTTLTGGAAVAALRLHRGLLGAGTESRFWHKKLPRKRRPKTAEQGVRPMHWPPVGANPVAAFLESTAGIARKLQQKRMTRRAFRGRNTDFQMFTVPWRGGATRYDHAAMRGDVVHLHWLTGMCDLPSFFASIPDDLPVVWTLHDQNAFTGGCHYAGACRGFETGCGDCPQLGQRGEYDLSQQIFVAKEAMVTGKNLHIVTPSEWNEREAGKSRIFSAAKSIQTIYNALDVDDYSPIDRSLARQQLGLPLDKTIMVFGADRLGSSFKGMPQLAAALTQLHDKDDMLGLAFGSGAMPEVAGSMPEIVYTGYIDTLERQVAVYSAADVYVLPSLADNMPQTAVEAMACGLPVVAFDVGGIPELVVPGKTGLLADLRNDITLARHLQWMHDHPQQRQEMGRQARRHVVGMFEARQQTQRHIELYQRIVGQSKAHRRAAA